MWIYLIVVAICLTVGGIYESNKTLTPQESVDNCVSTSLHGFETVAERLQVIKACGDAVSTAQHK